MQYDVDGNQISSNFQVFLENQNVIIVIMHSNVDVNQINNNFQVLLRPQYYYYYYSYGVQCGCKSDQ